MLFLDNNFESAADAGIVSVFFGRNVGIFADDELVLLLLITELELLFVELDDWRAVRIWCASLFVLFILLLLVGVELLCAYEPDVVSDGLGCANLGLSVASAADFERCRNDGIDEDDVLLADGIAEGIPVVGVVIAVVGSDGDSVASDNCCGGGRLSACDDCVDCNGWRLRADDVNDVGSLSFVIGFFVVASWVLQSKNKMEINNKKKT